MIGQLADDGSHDRISSYASRCVLAGLEGRSPVYHFYARQRSRSYIHMWLARQLRAVPSVCSSVRMSHAAISK